MAVRAPRPTLRPLSEVEMSIAEEMLFEGESCIKCGEPFGEGLGPGHPRICSECDDTLEKDKQEEPSP